MTFINSIFTDPNADYVDPNDPNPADKEKETTAPITDPNDPNYVDPNKVIDNTDKKEEEEEIIDPTAFWSTVGNILGTEPEVDFGDNDPLSIEGAVKYMEAFGKTKLNSFIEEINNSTPDALEYLEYRRNGGDPNRYFELSKELDFPEEITEDEAANLVVKSLKEKGLDKKYIDSILENMQEEGTVVTEAEKYVQEKRLAYDQQKQTLLLEQEAYQQQIEAWKTEMVNAVSETTKAGKLGNFTIPQDERESFANAVLPNIRVLGDGSFLLVNPIKKEDLQQTLMEEYFKYKKGDLSRLIENQVNNKRVQDLRLSYNNPMKDNNHIKSEDKPALDYLIGL